jgi:hypothetical protein
LAGIGDAAGELDRATAGAGDAGAAVFGELVGMPDDGKACPGCGAI